MWQPDLDRDKNDLVCDELVKPKLNVMFKGYMMALLSLVVLVARIKIKPELVIFSILYV